MMRKEHKALIAATQTVGIVNDEEKMQRSVIKQPNNRS